MISEEERTREMVISDWRVPEIVRSREDRRASDNQVYLCRSGRREDQQQLEKEEDMDWYCVWNRERLLELKKEHRDNPIVKTLAR